MCWIIAITSSISTAIMGSMIPAASRHIVHQWSTITGCEMTSRMCVSPSGTTSTPKNATIHGIVRHRDAVPM